MIIKIIAFILKYKELMGCKKIILIFSKKYEISMRCLKNPTKVTLEKSMKLFKIFIKANISNNIKKTENFLETQNHCQSMF